jgi:hypothetical protein
MKRAQFNWACVSPNLSNFTVVGDNLAQKKNSHGVKKRMSIMDMAKNNLSFQKINEINQ